MGGNIDWERFLKEVLIPLKKGEIVNYRLFDCRTFSLGEPIVKNPAALNVIEGVYSMHLKLAEYYDFFVFLKVDPQTQKRLIEKRNTKEIAKRYFEEWIPMEQIYFEKMKAEARCDLVIPVKWE